MLNNKQIFQYLHRIGLSEMPVLTLGGLRLLTRAQLTHVPFENIDIWRTGCCPDLSTDSLYRKVVLDRRGGYCFELNTLFRILLNSLGFDAYQCIASLVHEDHIDPPAHNVILCRLDGKKYLVDVGFGGPVPFGPMELAEGTADGFCLRLQDDTWYLERTDGIKPAFCFRDIPVEVRDLEPLNFYISQRPDSHFRHILRCNLRKVDGTVYTLLNDHLQIHRAGETKTETVSDINRVLESCFGINIDFIDLRKE